MPGAIEVRETALRSRLEQMRANDEWHLFQNFVLGLRLGRRPAVFAGTAQRLDDTASAGYWQP